MGSNSFAKFYLIAVAMPIQGCGVARNRRLFSGVGFLTTPGVGVDIFSDSGSPIGSLLHHTPKLEFLLNRYNFL